MRTPNNSGRTVETTKATKRLILENRAVGKRAGEGLRIALKIGSNAERE